MAEKYDEVERSMGICSYASKCNGFAAVLKARYSDFVVHEVDANGNVARLTSLDNNLKEKDDTVAKPIDVEMKGIEDTSKKRTADAIAVKNDSEEEAKKAKLSNNDENELAATSLDSGSALSEIQVKLSVLLEDEIVKQIMDMISSWESQKGAESTNEKPFPPPKGVQDGEKFITLPLIENKETRRGIHMLIKSDLVKPFAAADTVDKKVRIWHVLFEKQMPNYGKFVKDDRFKKPKKPKKEWPCDRPDFLKFILYKENIDTGTAARDIARTIRLPPKGNRFNKGGSGQVGYCGMKDKRGVTSQYCTVYRKTPLDLMVLNRERKNKYGGGNSSRQGKSLLRVGHFSYVDRDLRLGQLQGNRFDIILRNVCVGEICAPNEERISRTTEVLQKAALSMKDVGFINYFGMQRFGKFHDTHKVGIEILKGNFEEACEIIMRLKDEEDERAKVPRKKWAERFVGINLEDERSAKDAEMKCAQIVVKQLGRFMNCETSIVSSLSRKPRDYKKAFGSIAKHMRSMFLHAYQSYIWNKAASHRIAEGGKCGVRCGDLVLVEDKGLKDGGNGTSGLKGKAVSEVTQDDIETCKYSISDVVLPLVGSKIVYPTDSTGDYIESLLEEDGLSKDHFERIGDRELAVGGDYRKVMCKPFDVESQIKVYKDPVQPLIQTDLMGVQNEPLHCIDVTTDADQSQAAQGEKIIIGMVIGFTLPPSAYATVALRELMKRPTSSTYQSELSLEGDCEANVGKVKKQEATKVNSTVGITIGAALK
eukprot:CAMPEP_0194072820 /NCGR_PEP_ID=MMETSP0149-20130528/457_1 /TAXON_ID=122233 /ORGANISM="Chaetoceros debilis, Strain MM31A-1" /LENGTH=764 /DNA_ID=CAMNT_0038752741 /DNA_START=52 /DNA_END=2343 /DNA_ORIENTATION=+